MFINEKIKTLIEIPYKWPRLLRTTLQNTLALQQASILLPLGEVLSRVHILGAVPIELPVTDLSGKDAPWSQGSDDAVAFDPAMQREQRLVPAANSVTRGRVTHFGHGTTHGVV